MESSTKQHIHQNAENFTDVDETAPTVPYQKVVAVAIAEDMELVAPQDTGKFVSGWSNRWH